MFCVIYDSDSGNFIRLLAGVSETYTPSLNVGEDFILVDKVPPVLNSSWSIMSDGTLQPPPPPPPPTDEELAAARRRQYEIAIQSWLDETARSRGYSSIISACSYAGFDNPFKSEGCDFVAWRGDVWKYCYIELDKILAGEREEPESPEWFIENELPQFSSPYTPIDWDSQ